MPNFTQIIRRNSKNLKARPVFWSVIKGNNDIYLFGSTYEKNKSLTKYQAVVMVQDGKNDFGEWIDITPEFTTIRYGMEKKYLYANACDEVNSFRRMLEAMPKLFGFETNRKVIYFDKA